MAKFDFPYTCPDIDEAKEDFKRNLSLHLKNMIEEVRLTYEDPEYIAEQWVDIIFDDIDPCIEKIRECNSNMRDKIKEILKKL